MSTTDQRDADRSHLLPCGCLLNRGGAHRGDCPDFETVRPYPGCNRLNELTWRPREGER